MNLIRKSPPFANRFVLGIVCLLLSVFSVLPATAQDTDPSWRQKLGTFRIGILAAGRPVLATRRVQPFREALQGALGMPVEVFAAKDYNTLIEAHRASRIEYAVYSASAFSAAWLLCKCVTPIAAPVATDGSARFRSVLIARKSAAQSLDDLGSATILVPGRDSFSGFIFPQDRLARDGVEVEARGWELRDMQSMDAALEAFSAGEADAIFGWQGEEPSISPADAAPQLDTMDRLVAAGADVSVIWKSPPVPYGPHAIRSGIAQEAKELILPFLAGLIDDNPEAYEAIETRYTGGFQPIGFEDYKPVVDALRKPILFPVAPSAGSNSQD